MLLLAIIAASPGHGYAIAQNLRDRSDGAFDLPEGTIYPALHRLERKGFLNSNWQKAEGRNRRVYDVTPEGSRMLASQTETWAAMQHSIKLVLGGAI